jgi:hypothetical protein
MIKFIDNIGDFFSSNYFDEDFVKKVHDKSGYSFDDQKELQKRITPLKDKYYRYKQNIIEGRLRIKDKIFETHQYHTQLLNALGYDGDHHQYNEPFHFNGKEVIPIRHKLYRGDKLHLLIMEMQTLIKEGDEEPDGLFEQRYHVEEEEHESKEQRYHRVQWTRVFQISEELKISPIVINKAISELSLLDQKERPQYIMILAGNKVFLVEAEKWFRGSYLQFDIEELFTEATIERKYYSLFYLMLSKEMLGPDSEMVLMDQLAEDSHKSAYEVTKDLKEGIIHAVEALANEALYYKKVILKEEFDESDGTFEQEVKDDCLSIVYRLLFVFYAESRADLDILPISDSVYQKGYSLEMLRDLEQTQLITDHSRNGYFFHESLKQLFHLMSNGYRENENQTIKLKNGEVVSTLKNKSFRIRHIDSPMFDDNKLHQLKEVKFRNFVWQDVICQLSLSRKQNNKTRGRISYANLGINQLGSVYESLLAYRGFYAEEDYIEVHPKKKPNKGTLLVQRKRRDDFHEDEVLKDETGKEVKIDKGTFVYRLSGRDRQKSASYYTPEVLTQCTVKYTLKSILEKLENGDMKAPELLDLKLLEPAMGAAAFHNELINQLAESYLNHRQKEKKQKISPEKYREELQKVKAYIATNNAYGVDLNPTAIELGKLSLWLNVIHKDMETPFFANRLAVGNAVVGAWFKVYTQSQLKKKWWEKAPKLLQLGPGGKKRANNEIYHFLLLDKGMVPSAGIKLLKDEFPTHAARVSSWRRKAIKPITGVELRQLQKICDSIDEQLREYYTFQKRLNAQTKNKLDIWGGFQNREQIGLNLRSYDEKEQLNDQRNRQSAPYYKLKMVMDYWCSLWFWDVRKAEYLPSRQQYINDITSILNIDLTKKSKTEKVASFSFKETQHSLFENPSIGEQAQKQIIEKTQKGDLFDNKERLDEVKNLSTQHRFFHNQLEFIDVYVGRGGFDLVVGNPPWVKVAFSEDAVYSESYPEFLIRKMKPKDKEALAILFIQDTIRKELMLNEIISTESQKTFLGATQIYGDLKGMKPNLYKNFYVQVFDMYNKRGCAGIISPDGLYDDTDGDQIREKLYNRLRYHFQFENNGIFAEIHSHVIFSINILTLNKETIEFEHISNLTNVKSIDKIYSNNDSNYYGIKTSNNKPEINGNKHRIISVNNSFLDSLYPVLGGASKPSSMPLPVIHDKRLVNAILKVTSKRLLKDIRNKVSNKEAFRETQAKKNGEIQKIDNNPEYIDELVMGASQIYVGNALYKEPNIDCSSSTDFSVIDHQLISDSYIPRALFKLTHKGKEKTEFIKNYYLVNRMMVDTTWPRTYVSAILPPFVKTIHALFSCHFIEQADLVSFASFSQSIIYDFIIKVKGKSNVVFKQIETLPVPLECFSKIISRGLRLQCHTSFYADLWFRNFKEEFKNDSFSKRLPYGENEGSNWNALNTKWSNIVALKSPYYRRQAQLEIDVLVAMHFGLSLEELISIYRIQFFGLQKVEENTFYDQTGKIVYTSSTSQTGNSVNTDVWNQIKKINSGQNYIHENAKSKIYKGIKVKYIAPFFKLDRVEDYKTAWAHFEKIFKED